MFWHFWKKRNGSSTRWNSPPTASSSCRKALRPAENAAGAGHGTDRSPQAAAQRLQREISSELMQLDMPKIRFVCEFSEQTPQENGLDAVRFLMSANVGEALRPLSKVASGGELARIMLAMKTCWRPRIPSGP
ncbi:MAG: hypothetical protein ACLT1T_05655 [Oscillospiraceae bacterium]